MNPIDLTITGYWAKDITDKIVYPSVSFLLKERCPKLYCNYKRMLNGKSKENNSLLLEDEKKQISKPPTKYIETDIYKASREIRKMQKIHNKILTIWIETDDYIEELPMIGN